MSRATGDNRLVVLAAEIQAADGRCRRNAEESAAAAIEAGRKLIEAKALLAHGAWGAWLQDHAGLSDRTARRYMQLARSGLEIGHVADIGIRRASEAAARRGQRCLPPRGYEAWAAEITRLLHLLPDAEQEQWLTAMRAYVETERHLPDELHAVLEMDGAGKPAVVVRQAATA